MLRRLLHPLHRAAPSTVLSRLTQVKFTRTIRRAPIGTMLFECVTPASPAPPYALVFGSKRELSRALSPRQRKLQVTCPNGIPAKFVCDARAHSPPSKGSAARISPYFLMDQEKGFMVTTLPLRLTCRSDSVLPNQHRLLTCARRAQQTPMDSLRHCPTR
jgi:hypothetical protein